jgi:hypothetical protein
MLNKIKNSLKRYAIIRNLVEMRHSSLLLIYKISDLNDDYYNIIKSASYDKEVEHQIGRLTNYKKILSEIKSNNIYGDIIEFGTWRGFSLLWISYLYERQGLFDKKIIGIDSFEGLPGDEGIFSRGDFSDTSYVECRENIFRSKDLYSITKRNIIIDKYSFSQKKEIMETLKKAGVSKFCFIHIDCDISSSAREIFDILIEGDLIGDRCYILFDDYGCMDSYGKSIEDLMSELKDKWKVSDHSRTKLTKNFYLEK